MLLLIIVAFRIYDVDEDNYISVDDFTKCLKLMVGDNMDQATVRRIAKRSVREADADGDGKLSEEEFAQALAGTKVEEILHVAVP